MNSDLHHLNGSFNGANEHLDHATLNAKDLFWKYLRYLWLFALVTAVSVGCAWLYMRYTKPLYSVTSTLLIKEDRANRGGGGMGSQDMFSDIALFQSNLNKQNEILILTSRSLMERVVRSLGLQTSYQVIGNIKVTDVYPEHPFTLELLKVSDSSAPITFNISFNQDWSRFRLEDGGEEFPSGRILELPQGTIRVQARRAVYSNLPFRKFLVSWSPIEPAAIQYTQRLQVKPANDQSNVLSLTFTGENTKLATAVLNELMRQYNDAAIEDKNEMNRKILAFINDRLGLVERQLDSVEGNLQLYRSSQHVINLETQSTTYFGNATELNQNLRQLQVQYQVVELLEQYLSQPANRLSLVPSTLGLTDPTLVELTIAYNKLVTDRMAQLQTGATLDNPVVKNLEAAIEEARVKMMESLKNIKAVYLANIEKVRAEAGSIRKEIASLPERERRSREKARQQEIKQNLYLYLMQKREESEIAQASTIANSRIIDRALPIENLVNPQATKVYGIALMVGLLLPIGIIALRDILNDKITTRADIVKNTSTPVLGEIGHSAEEKVLLFPNSSRTIVAEQLRILRSNLRFVLGDKFENPVILVTSSFSGEGKSFISTNLGATLAISGKRTVILEFDLRKPKIMTGLGLAKGHGLTNFLVGGARLSELPQAVPQVENLYVIPCGPVPPNPSEILMTSKIQELFEWLKQNFDAVVIDTAPVGLVSDAFTLSQFADCTTYVVRQRYTFKRQMAFIEELYRQKKLPHMGLLVNDVVAQGSKGYYGYGGGMYGYSYGYGYANGYGADYFDNKKVKTKRSIIKIRKN